MTTSASLALVLASTDPRTPELSESGKHPRLGTVDAVRRGQARVYREMRAGEGVKGLKRCRMMLQALKDIREALTLRRDEPPTANSVALNVGTLNAVGAD